MTLFLASLAKLKASQKQHHIHLRGVKNIFKNLHEKDVTKNAIYMHIVLKTT